MTAELKATMEPVVDFCDAGMMRLVVPVLQDGVIAGQVKCLRVTPRLMRNWTPSGSANNWERREEEAESLIRTVRTMEEDELRTYGETLMNELNG